MSPGDVVNVDPAGIRFKLSRDTDLGGVCSGDWDIVRRVEFERTAKYKAIAQHFVDGVPWIETELFRNSYARRFRLGDHVRDAVNLADLARQYEERVDTMFESLKRDGFLREIGGRPVPLPKIHIGRDGEILLGNQGNHRLSMAKVIGMPRMVARINTIHSEYRVSA